MYMSYRLKHLSLKLTIFKATVTYEYLKVWFLLLALWDRPVWAEQTETTMSICTYDWFLTAIKQFLHFTHQHSEKRTCIRWQVTFGFKYISMLSRYLAKYFRQHTSQLMRLWYLSHRRPVKAQASLRIRAVSPEPALFAHITYGSSRRVTRKIRHLASLAGCACAFEDAFTEAKSTIISWHRSVTILILLLVSNIPSNMLFYVTMFWAMIEAEGEVGYP